MTLEIHPFCGLRPHPDRAEEVVSPPYDLMDQEGARALAKNKPFSFLRVTRSDLEFQNESDPYGEQVYERARKNLNSFIEKKIFIQDKEKSYYVYRTNSSNHQQTGLAALFSVEDYCSGRIKKHELTQPEKEKDRIKHINTVEAHTGPVFLLYREQNTKGLSSFLDSYADSQRPLYKVQGEDGVLHRFYRIHTERDKKKLEEYLSSIDCAYIADGHHRAASAARAALESSIESSREDSMGSSMESSTESSIVGKKKIGKSKGHFLAAIFPDTQVQILPYYRAVRSLNGLSKEEVLQNISANGFQISKGKYVNLQQHQANMCLEGMWYKISWGFEKETVQSVISSLAVNVLQERILNPVFGISNPRTSPNIGFIGGIYGESRLEDLIKEKKYIAAFSFTGVQSKDLLEAADTDQIMPPKSTWFEPKLLSGFIVHLFR